MLGNILPLLGCEFQRRESRQCSQFTSCSSMYNHLLGHPSLGFCSGCSFINEGKYVLGESSVMIVLAQLVNSD